MVSPETQISDSESLFFVNIFFFVNILVRVEIENRGRKAKV